MKRKLNADDVPTEPGLIEKQVLDPPTTVPASSFSSLGLEPRLLQAIAKENFSEPTDVQAKVIPIALEGKDILARSKTGSGKTAAYVLPILQSILKRKHSKSFPKSTIALILVPTRELAQQVSKTISTFSTFCSKDIRTTNLTQKANETVQRVALAECPDIVVATPARASQHIQSSALSIDSLKHLVIDEADLVLSYGYDDDLKIISNAAPKMLQTILLSATLTADVSTLKGLFCRDPILLDLQETADDGNGITQYVVKCAEDEKFLLIYVIFKLKLIKGKCIIFVGDTDRCYRLKLFFEQFGIKSCVLNSELPVNSRIHVVEEFNKNVYDIIIAADEHEVLESRQARSVRSDQSRGDDDSGDVAVNGNAHTNDDTLNTTEITSDQRDRTSDDIERPGIKPSKRSKRNKEYGVARGIDFQNVSYVLNFDLPTTSKSYTHRIGRTARAGKSGMALSFVIPSDLYHKHPSTSFPSAQHDEEVLEKISSHQQKKGKELKPYHFDMKQVDAFRYRMNDALRAVTRIAIREARTRELRQELLKSEKLERHFEEHPEDLSRLRHDNESRAARIQQHLRHVPDYLMPSNGSKGITGDQIGFVGLRKPSDNRIRKARAQKRMQGKGKKTIGRRLDPLKTFSTRRKP